MSCEKTEDTKEMHKIKIDTPDTGYESFPVYIIRRSTYEALTFDPLLGKPAVISYSLTKAGVIRLRICRRDRADIVLLTLQDWTSQEFGEHKVLWDGRDASGNIIDNKNILVTFDSRDQAFSCKHLEHDTESCYDPKLEIKTNPESNREIRGEIEILSLLSGKQGNIKWGSGCEVKYFIDYGLVKTETFKKTPDKFTFKLDTAKLRKGEHMITVNAGDLNDHIATASVKIYAP